MQEYPANPLVSIIIVNFNGLQFLEPCLSSLMNQSCKNFEIILVDNGSSDGSADYVRNQFATVKIIETGKNLGFSGGTNTGIHAAKGEYILTLNNDTIADPYLLEEIQKPMIFNTKVGMCASKILFPDNSINSTGICISRSGAAWDRGIYEPDDNCHEQQEEVFGPCAGSALYRREMLDQIGMFDEDFFMYMEDVDLAFRGQFSGWKCIYVPTARIIHKHGGTAGINSDLSIFYSNRNLLWNVVKNFPMQTILISSPWIIGRYIADIPFYILKGKGRAILKAKIASLKGLSANYKKRKRLNKKIPDADIEKWIQTWMKIGKLKPARIP
jgi:GT2 family glycosyltransferase